MSDFRIKNGMLMEYTGRDKNVVIPDSVTSIVDGAFICCSSLRSISIPDSVTSIGDRAFGDCSSLTSISIPDSVIYIRDSAFSGCSSLKSISIPDGVTSIGEKAFAGCKNLTSISIPDSVTSIGNAVFRGCKALADQNGFVIIRNVLCSYEGEGKSITIPDDVTSIGKDAFVHCSSLTNISIPDSVTSIGDNAFSECESLTSISIPDSVTSIGGGAFHGCRGLADKTRLVVIRGVLYDYVGASTSINIPDSVTSIGERAFYGCRSLTSISIPDSVTSIGGWAFYGCRSLTSISIPAYVTSIGRFAFSGCISLKNFTCPSSFAKELQTILPKTKTPIILHIPDISDINTKFRPGAAVGFAEDNRDCIDENGKTYAKYIKTNAAKLADLAIEHPTLFYLMLREKLISAKDLDAFTKAVQDNGNTELIAAILDYANSGVPEKDKAKVQQKKETLDTNVTNFLFDATKMEKISGKTFAVTGKLKTFANRDELKACLDACGATLTESLSRNVNYLITNTPDSDTAKNREAESLGIPRITEAQFNEMVGRKV